MYGITAGDNGTIVAVGRTDGDFLPFVNSGGFDFFALKIESDGPEMLWQWQVRLGLTSRSQVV